MGAKTTRLAVRIGAFEFRPALVPTLLTAVLLPVLLRLGVWQLDRAGEKRAILELYEQRAQESPLTIDGGMNDIELLRYRTIEARGQYDGQHHFLLDNRVHNGIPGYHVITPIRLRGTEVGVLVNRGWIPLGRSRADLPEINSPVGDITVQGVVKEPVPSVFDLEPGEAYAAGWPKVVQHIKPHELETMLHYPLMPYVILLDPGERDGYVRAWKPVTMSPEKHTSYAVQWFGLSLALILIYLVVNTQRIRE